MQAILIVSTLNIWKNKVSLLANKWHLITNKVPNIRKLILKYTLNLPQNLVLKAILKYGTSNIIISTFNFSLS